jgi:dTDP-glucose 4,6-dehydratase
MTNTLITGGAGFIGSHVIKLFVKDKSYNVFNLDSLTYAGSLNNIEGLKKKKTMPLLKEITSKKER